MRNQSVAILDIRSNEVFFSLGAKGVNGTFVISNSHAEKYEGFSKGAFLDEKSLRKAVSDSVNSVRQNYGGTIKTVYVGVPSAFISVLTKGHTVSFSSKRKVSSADVDYLYESGWNELAVGGRCIRRSSMYYSLGDNRKYFSAEDLYGAATTSLQGGLCYYCISEQFYQMLTAILKELGIEEMKFIPSTLAQSLYLMPDKKRKGYAFLLDVGFLTSSISVIYGSGIVHEETFDFGVGTVLVELMDELGVDLATAEEILSTSNISGGIVPNNLLWTSEFGDRQFPVRLINDVIKSSLDTLCEQVDSFFQIRYKDKKTSGFLINPISLTGEGISAIKGSKEHISKRISRLTEVVVPDLPYFDKPAFSSRIALLNMAIVDGEKRSVWKKIFNIFGGKKK